jgi:hypothetical protein
MNAKIGFLFMVVGAIYVGICSGWKLALIPQQPLLNYLLYIGITFPAWYLFVYGCQIVGKSTNISKIKGALLAGSIMANVTLLVRIIKYFFGFPV